jgi:hypothetical protein
MDQRGVTFRTKVGEFVTLDGITFLQRWLRHVLPRGFTKIRHYGLMSASHATTRLEVARGLLPTKSESVNPVVPEPQATPTRNLRTAKWHEVIRILTGIDIGRCSACGSHALERRPLPRAIIGARAPPKAA